MANIGLEEYQRKLKAGLIKKTRDKNRPSATNAIKEKCAECMCQYQDGRIDCEIKSCSLYYFMPYGQLKKDRKLQKANQKIINEI